MLSTFNALKTKPFKCDQVITRYLTLNYNEVPKEKKKEIKKKFTKVKTIIKLGTTPDWFDKDTDFLMGKDSIVMAADSELLVSKTIAADKSGSESLLHKNESQSILKNIVPDHLPRRKGTLISQFPEAHKKPTETNVNNESSIKAISFKKPSKHDSIEEMTEFINAEPEPNKFELKRLEIAAQLEKNREYEKAANARKYFETVKFINEDLLSNLMQYPLLPKDLLMNQNSDMYDETEKDIARSSLFKAPLDKKLYLPAVTAVINIATPEEKRKNLIKWQVDKIMSLGYEGLEELNKINMKRGRDFHKSIETLMTGGNLVKENLDSDIIKSVDSIEKLIAEEFRGEMVMMEKKTVHENLMYKGRIDFMGYYKDSLCLIDWKRSDLPKRELSSLYDAPIQAAAYIGAYLNDPEFENIRSKHHIKNAIIVNVCKDGEINLHVLKYQQIEFYWYRWLSFLRNYWFFVLQQKPTDQ